MVISKPGPAQADRQASTVLGSRSSCADRSTKGRTGVERVIRVVAAKERVKATQSAVMRRPSVKTEVNAQHAEEEEAEAEAEALAAYDHIRSTPDLRRPGSFRFF